MVWICNICGTKNTDDKASCVACAAAKGRPAPTAIDFPVEKIFNVIAELTPKPPKAAGVVVISKAAAGAHDDGDEKGDDADRREAERKAREEAKRKADKAKADAERKAQEAERKAEEAERKAQEAKRKADAQGQGGIPKIKLVPRPGDAVVGAAADRKALDAIADAEHKAHEEAGRKALGNIAQNVAMADAIAAEVERQVKANADKANADKANADKAKEEVRKRVKKELEQERRYRSIGQIIIALIVGVIGTLLVTKGFKFAADVKHDYHKILNNLEGIINTSDIIRLRKMLNQINNPKVDEEIKQYEMELKTRYPNRPHVTPLQADMLLEKIQHLTSHQIAMLVNPPQTQKVLPKDVMNNINNINNIPVFAMGKKRKVKKNLKKSIRRPRR